MDAGLLLSDTVSRLSGAAIKLVQVELRSPGSTRVDMVGVEMEALFAGRSMWAVGPDWLALGHSDSSQITVYDRGSGRIRSIVRWPTPRKALTDEDRETTAKWILATQATSSSSVMSRFLARRSNEIAEGIEFTLIHTLIADSVPTFTRVLANRQCLFIAGFDPAGSADGVSLTWVVIDTRSGVLEGVIRLKPAHELRLGKALTLRGGDVLAVKDSSFYLGVLDENGESFLEIHTVTGLKCLRQ